ncbi:MAG: hypothetical protein FJW30_26145 [Acidobacteria bacterium]|nr:hypothetical protein [Acidobacteriota bacterium]
MPPVNPPKPADDDDDDDPATAAIVTDLKERAARRKSLRARRAALSGKLVQLLELDPAKEAEASKKAYEACLESARKRIERLRAEDEKRRKKAPPLIDQLRRALERKGV